MVKGKAINYAAEIMIIIDPPIVEVSIN